MILAVADWTWLSSVNLVANLTITHTHLHLTIAGRFLVRQTHP
jgi:hypothetical protein